MGINLPSNTRPPIVSSGSISETGFPNSYNWNRPPWMFTYPFGNPWQPSAALGGPNQAVSGGLPTRQDSLDSVKELLSGFQDSMKAEFSSLNSRLSVLESSSKSTTRVLALSPSPESQENEVDREDDEISVAPGSQERVFLDDEESDHDNPTDPQPVKRVSSSGGSASHLSVVDGPSVPETDAPSLSKENLRSRVYTLMRDVAKVPFDSPPKPKRISSTFEASCGLNS